jgi:ABC-type siderophore export system fused ATPase/permease subunit
MRTRSAVVYTVLRLLAFLVPLGIMLLFPIFQQLYWLAAIFAALIGLALSMLFLRRPLDDVSTGLAERRAGRTTAAQDAEIEDAANDIARGETPSGDAPRAE